MKLETLPSDTSNPSEKYVERVQQVPWSTKAQRLLQTRTHWRSRLLRTVTGVYESSVKPIFCKKQIEAAAHGRCVPLRLEHQTPLVDPRRGHAFVSNDIRTSRYTIWDFLPKQALFQFSRVGNFYFLCVGIPQTIPGLSTTGSFTTILPLLFFVLLTVVKEGFDDYRRHRLDTVENANFATTLGRKDNYTGKLAAPSIWTRWNPFKAKIRARPRPSPPDEFNGIKWVPKRWSDLKVGDVIRLSRDEPVPADIVLLSSTGENGLACIDTMALDGETNLKNKQVSQVLEDCSSIKGIDSCRAEFVVENPNPELFNFDGHINLNGTSSPLTLNEVIYRGSVLRNTAAVTGLVINTGEECKVRMNANQHPRAKKPALERVVNRIVITLAIYVVILSVGVSMGYIKWQKKIEQHSWYLDGASVPFHEIIIAFIIMFNNVVPLALYISLEIVKIGQLLFLNSDVAMYDEETDTPARCNTNTILENLGQVGYIFSDKTGTLTDNIMKFRKISVAGTVWLHEMGMEQDGATEPDNSETESTPATDMDDSSRDASIDKPEPMRFSTPVKSSALVTELPMSPRLSTGGRRSSSHWRSTGRPDHVQPEVNTTDLLEFIRLRPHSAFARKAKEYILAMALCHTCLPENIDGKVEYQASSPDELALVRAARELGYIVATRTSKSISVDMMRVDGTMETLKFDILDVIEFTSSRKRMSIVVRYPDGKISVICKGADSAILPRLKQNSLAKQKANEVRMSADIEHEKLRRSEQLEPRNSSQGGRTSLTIRRTPGITRQPSGSKPSLLHRRKSFEINKLMRRSEDMHSPLAGRGGSFDISRRPMRNSPAHHVEPLPANLQFLEDQSVFDDSDVFTKCFQHLEDFATEGLRTLLFAQKFMSESEYRSWKKVFDDATTSLENRKELLEAAGDMIEQSFELVGATAIEDKLQRGVPETIDKLRRANIKIWMLTGDKRETAINIAHSARLCKPGSDLYILDVAKGDIQFQLMALAEDLQAGSIHSVAVIDGYTLSIVEKSPDLLKQFFSTMVCVDSVICCRASPAQKALLVRTVRSSLGGFREERRRGLTLAIGDGANDLAMIQASHVGIGISGKEGLQAARVADYSIAQFRFLQRLLLVHGRWNYVRTAKFILATFWKEMFFYLPTAIYQRYNGYTGTSLYQDTSLTVFNTLFTSLCTICMGIWEQDLSAETLLAMPELYTYGQRNIGLNAWKYLRWMLLAAIEGVAAWYLVWAGYSWLQPNVLDHGLYAIGTLAFTVGILWINWKLFIFETHYKSNVVMWCFFITTFGWFAWLAFLDGVFAPSISPYSIRGTFTSQFGKDAVWWATLFGTLGVLGLFEMVLKTIKRSLLLAGLWKWPTNWKRVGLSEDLTEWDLELWQELEQNPIVKEELAKMAREGFEEDEEEGEEAQDAEEDAAPSRFMLLISRLRKMIP